jgi:mRNA-degrading endonuclease RelE of RelBE toxin-antitoxin system
MKVKVELDPQVADFVRSLAPDPRRRLRAALHGLEEERGDLKQLEADLAGYARLRAGGYRVLVRFYSDRGQRVARCVFAERRPVVYELFAEILRGEVGGE